MDPGEEVEWEETARWIKFEEDVEEGSGRWGRPHVSALTFHSLVELRRGLEEGNVNGVGRYAHVQCTLYVQCIV